MNTNAQLVCCEIRKSLAELVTIVFMADANRRGATREFSRTFQGPVPTDATRNNSFADIRGLKATAKFISTLTRQKPASVIGNN
jgi:hypothetical protein